MRTLLPRLTDYSKVEIMVVARPMRGAEGMGAAAVGQAIAPRPTPACEVPSKPKEKVDIENATICEARSQPANLRPARHIQLPMHQAFPKKIGFLLV